MLSAEGWTDRLINLELHMSCAVRILDFVCSISFAGVIVPQKIRIACLDHDAVVVVSAKLA